MARDTTPMLLGALLTLLFWRCTHEVNAPLRQARPGKMVISEVLYDPAGSNAGAQLVELRNVGGEPVAMNGWWLCARQDYAQLPNVTLADGAVLVVHVGANGTNTDTDAYLPFMLTLQPISDLNLFQDANFNNPASMVHFVQWGGVPPTSRQSEAVIQGLWISGDFVPTVAEGHSIEYDGEGNRASDWFDQPTPNIGQ